MGSGDRSGGAGAARGAKVSLPSNARIVVKVGSRSIAGHAAIVAALAAQMAAEQGPKRAFTIVTSGAIALGASRLGYGRRPKEMPRLQAAAAANHPVAQYELGQMYEEGGLVPRDVDLARDLYAAASRHGMKEATDRLAVLGPPDKRLRRPAPLASNISSSVNLLDSLGGSASSFPTLGGGGGGGDAYFVQVGAFQNRA